MHGHWLGCLVAATGVLAGCEQSTGPSGGGSGSAQSTDCALVIAAIYSSYTVDQVAQFRSDPTLSKWFDTTREVTERACRDDGWPEAVKHCIVTAKAGGVKTCQTQMSAALHDKLEARLRDAMNASVKIP